jgi:hypothetical protein
MHFDATATRGNIPSLFRINTLYSQSELIHNFLSQVVVTIIYLKLYLVIYNQIIDMCQKHCSIRTNQFYISVGEEMVMIPAFYRILSFSTVFIRAQKFTLFSITCFHHIYLYFIVMCSHIRPEFLSGVFPGDLLAKI